MTATARHSASQIHSLPVIIGVAWKLGAIDKIPPKISVTAPVVTKENAESVTFLQEKGLLYA
jgi:ribose transport system substrate-binding protein